MRENKKYTWLIILVMLISTIQVNIQATSTNGLARTMIKVARNYVFYDTTTANAVRITFKDNDHQDETFYLEITNSKWSDDALTKAYGEPIILEGTKAWKFEESSGIVDGGKASVTYIKQSDTTMKVKVDGKTINVKGRYSFPLLVEVTDENATVSLKGGTTLTEGKWTFATISDFRASWSLGMVNTIGTNGKVAEIKVSEAYRGAMKDEDLRFTLELDSTEYVFDIEGESVESEYDQKGYTTYKISDKKQVEFMNGFLNKGTCIYMLVKDRDHGSIDFIIPAIQGGTSTGSVNIKNLVVKTKKGKPTEGNLLANIISDDLSNAKNGIAIAKIEQYGIYAQMTGKPVEVGGGHIEEINFVIGEKVDDSLRNDRTLSMTLDIAKFDYRTLLTEYGETGKTPRAIEKMSHDEVLELNPHLDLVRLKKDRRVQIVNNVDLITDIAFEKDKDGKFNPSSLIITLAKDIANNDKIDRVTLKLPVYVPIDKRQAGSVSMTIEGPAAEEPTTLQVISINNPFNIKIEKQALKVGLQNQYAGKFTLIELKKGMLQAGEVIFKLDPDYKGIRLNGDSMEMHTEGGLKGIRASTSEDDCFLALVTLKETKEIGKFEVVMKEVDVDRTVPEGKIDLEISGTAIDAYGESIKLEDFFEITTKNTEDIDYKGLGKEKLKFTLGSKKGSRGKEEILMDVAPYIEEPGFIMVPVRYVAQGFGLGEQDITYNKEQGTSTLFAGKRIIQLTKGNKLATVNSGKVEMQVPVIIKDGRTFVSVSEVGKLLGVQASWDNETKEATFQYVG
ncbi:stalk domain-containing protein [Cellulosilyticum ruminicola]|uniref:stalk domain-containing protein n=1 Tax=Cellulosilyticum ruminicola TaxID=425254 RepID=UPI0006CF62C0|nr:stalk domain-containing protein [Cellulosilyticum ruminicola]